MSEIKVNSIKGVGASSAAISVDNTNGTCTLASGSKLNNCTTDGTTNLTIADGNLVVGTAGHGIDFSAQTASSASGASASSELLDHYEEGTWTPTSNVGSITVANAHYVKIGSIVLAQAYVTFPSMSGSASVELNGYPFATANSSDFYTAAVNSDTNLSNGQLCGQFVGTQMLFADRFNAKATVSQMSSKFVVVSVVYSIH